jgi:Tol biopolymer transport system component
LLAPPDTDFGNPFIGFAISPDGRLLVFSAVKKGASRPNLWLRPLSSLTATELPGTQNGNGVFWSPDSRSIGFVADDKLKRMDVSGGAAQTLCDAPNYEGGSWSTEGVILFGSAREGIRRVPATGGTTTQITTGSATSAVRGDLGHRYPYFLPDGHHFLYTSADPP